MTEKVQRAVAVVGVGAVLPDAPDAKTFWENIKASRYSVSEVPDDRWDPNLYYDPDPKAPLKTYSKIGGWAREWTWSPLEWRLPIPPTVSEQMDRTQVWGVVAAREALLDYGYPERPLDPDRTAVVLGNAMGGDRHYQTALRIFLPEYAEELVNAPSFTSLPADVRQAITDELRDGLARRLPGITEDTMSGELANITAGRVANLFNFHGPNFVVDAACASAMAAMDAAIEGLEQGDFDAVLTGGVDGNMSASTFVKFCKIGALSASGTRPYGEGADGFVMGEGAGVFLLKRLEDAEASGDRIYAVIRGLGGSSDGKGKGITAPNPIGQKFAVERAWRNAGRVPDSASLIEGHGTSTRVGDVVEVEAMSEVFSGLGLPAGSLPLGSVKSNIGHLKAAAGAAGMLKAIMALNDKVLPPSLNAERPNPNIDFGDSPLYVNTELQEWKAAPDQVRAAAVSAFGFGGTNFHTVIEEYIPGRIRTADHTTTYSLVTPESPLQEHQPKAPLRGALVIGDVDAAAVTDRLRAIGEEAGKGTAPPIEPPKEADLRAPYRVVIDYGDAAELADRTDKAVKAIEADNEAMWKALRNSGIFHGTGNPGMVAFLYTGQGSQYLNMLETLRETEPIVTEMFEEADRVMEPVLGRPLSDYIYVSSDDPEAIAKADAELRATEITQPAVLAVDEALSRLMDAYGIRPDMVMGHSLGEYGALVAAGALPFEDALEAVAGRGREMARVSMEDNGLMAAVFAPLEAVERVVESVDGYVVIANINSTKQAVIGGTTPAVEEAMRILSEGGAQVVPLPVSHAFHTEIVQPASEPLKEILRRLRLETPGIPLVANVDGELYPMGPNVASRMIDILGRQIASPVQFIKGLRTLYDAGCRVFVEMGPKRALYGFAEDVLGDDPEVVSLYTNHPKLGDVVSFNRGLCGLYAQGLGVGTRPAAAPVEATPATPVATPQPTPQAVAVEPVRQVPQAAAPQAPAADTYAELGRIFADFLERGAEVYRSVRPAADVPAPGVSGDSPVVVSGAGLGLPGMERVFDEDGVARILRGDQFIDSIPVRLRQEIVDHHITRLVKSEAGGGRFEEIDSQADVIKLAGRGGRVDLVEEFGYPAERVDALDRASLLAIGAGLAALRDAGIPLVMSYKTTTTGTSLPDRWMLPESMRDDTGVIFASAFPGYDAVMGEQARYQVDLARHQRLEELRALRVRASQAGGSSVLVEDLDHRIHDLETELANDSYLFDRKFLFRAVSMGHAQFAEYIGARGPNTQINGACASTTQAVSIAEDWITLGRCRRVIIISADDVTSDNMMQWIGSGFLAVGAAATDEVVEDAAVPFDRRRHGMILGMGAAGIVVEAPDSLRERGMQPIVEVVSSITANSAFHGSRLDPDHIRHVMERLVATAEQRWGIDRHEIAAKTAFISHETYTPARGGSAQAEVDSLRFVFGASADQIVVTNTKGFTGHAMGAGVEDVVAIKSLETGVVPPVPNYKEPDPDLGHLNLSQGGAYPVSYALRLGAGFGSQISLTLYRHVPSPLGRHPEPDELGFEYRVVDPGGWNRWLQSVTGYDAPQLEFQGRTVRVRDDGPPVRVPAAAPAVAPAAPALQPVAPAPAPAAAPAAEVQVPAEPATDVVAARVLEIVAGETGYPPDMLDLDLDLEADLGIDTVKQAEMFAAIRSEFGIERDDALALRDYPTLQAVIGFVYEKADGLEPPSVAAPAAAPVAVAAVAAPVESGVVEDPVRERVLGIVAGETGYPPDMLDLDLDLEADLGIDTVKQAEMFAAIRSEFGIERDDALALRDYPTLQAVIGFVYEKADGLEPPSVAAPAAAPVAVAAVAAPVESGVVEDPVRERVLGIVAGETGYPPDMLDLDLDLEADLGIDTVKQAEMFAAIRSEFGIERDDALALRDYPTLQAVIGFVYEKADGLEPPSVAAPAAAPVAVAAVAAPVESGVVEDPVRERVLGIVAGETGYPPDMLDLDLDLEADLGIDTVKQAEMFAAIRSEFGIERDDALALRDYPTLQAVIGFVYEKADGLEPPSVAAPAAAPVAAPMEAGDAASGLLLGDDAAAAEIPRRLPTPVLRPELDRCAPTSVTLGPGSKVLVMMDRGGVGAALVKRLQKDHVEVLAIDDAPAADDLLGRIDAWAGDGGVQGVYWLPALDVEAPVEDMDLAAWKEALRVRVKLLYAAMRHLYEQVADPGTFLLSATRLGGKHGYDDAGPPAPMGGAVTGFTKAYKRERPNALVKAVDFSVSRKTTAFAKTLVAETLRDPGVVEVGWVDDRRFTIALSEVPLPDSATGLELGPESVFVVTGAAGSIVSAITADLARASGGSFHLLDLVPEPNPDDPDVALFATDRDALKRTIFERLKESGERATPAIVDRELAGIERAAAALDAIRAVEAAGGTVHYHSVNLLDAAAMASVTGKITEISGKVDVLLHAGGLEISRALPHKEPGEYDLVFDVKADGWFNLLSGLAEVPVDATVAFSSIAGRFGNAGQTDYSAANDLLCKSGLAFRTSRPETTAIATDWTAWGDIGMATRGSIPMVMNAAGIDMLPAVAGIPIVRRELAGSRGSRELVVGLRLGKLQEEWDEAGGLDVAAIELEAEPGLLMVGQVRGFGIHDGFTIMTRLDPTEQPFLFDHQREGTPLLPGVMGVESFAAVAALAFPDLHVAAVEDVEFLAPFKFYRNEPRQLAIRARFRADGDDILADCELVGERILANQPEPQVTKHFSGTVRLAPNPPKVRKRAVPEHDGSASVESADIYRIYFHGPAYQVIERAWRNGDVVTGLFRTDLPDNHVPRDRTTVTEPRLVELCFQTAGVWEIGTAETMGLPMHIDRVVPVKGIENAKGRIFASVRLNESGFGVEVVDESGAVLVIMEGYRTALLPGTIDDDLVAPLRNAMEDR